MQADLPPCDLIGPYGFMESFRSATQELQNNSPAFPPQEKPAFPLKMPNLWEMWGWNKKEGNVQAVQISSFRRWRSPVPSYFTKRRDCPTRL